MANAKEETPRDKNEGVVIRPDLEQYVKGRSGSGKRTMRSTDDVATALDGFTLEETYAAAAKITGTKVADLQDKYGHLNVGMQRMNLGNRIRGAVAKADKEHASDKAKPTGASILEDATSKGRAAADKRSAEAAAAAEKRAADAAAKAAAAADAPAKKKGSKKTSKKSAKGKAAA